MKLNLEGRGSWQPRPFFLSLFTERRGIGILGSSPWFFSFVTVAVALRRR